MITPDLTFGQLRELQVQPGSPFGELRVVATDLHANPYSRDGNSSNQARTVFSCKFQCSSEGNVSRASHGSLP